MPDTLSQEEAIFQAALEIAAVDQRAAYLDEACCGQPELRRRVEALLRRYAESSGPLDRPANGLAASTDESRAECPGAVIGPYKLLEEIGEGGFGVVFMAEQSQPVRRKVAFKVLKPGMDTRQVVARFEAERQALALMDHPNIAHVFDGGETASGRPYFVMELVRGVPVTEFCDRNSLPIRQRLELFVTVCQAVQHAHQKGIIHRDLKPTNVLIASHDGTPVVKVIDFGIAKTMSGTLTDKTLFTGFAQMIGTPAYMSPEQAGQSSLDVDTRSDIYSLGVLLYELLTSTTPFAAQTLKKLDCDEMRRMIRDDEPPRPSERISTLEKSILSTVAEQHGVEPRRLSQQLRGELDWIVMKCLEKDRNRRYETAASLAHDIERYLHDEPVQACPPSAGYRLQKFLRRHKGAVLAVGMVLLALVAGIIGTTWGLVSAEKARSELQDQQTKTLAAEREKTLQVALARWSDARVSRQARRPGQRYHSLEALADTVRHLRSLDQLKAKRPELRDDALASLTLWDVRAVKSLAAAPARSLPAVDPLGHHYACADAPNAVSWRRLTDDQVVHRWQLKGNRCICLKVSPDGRYVAALCLDDLQPEKGVCHVWDSSTGRLVLEHPVFHRCGHDFRPDGKVLALAQSDGSIALCDLDTGGELPALPAGPMPESLRFDPNSQFLAVSFFTQPNIVVWDPAAAKVVLRLVGDQYVGSNLAWSPDGALLAVSSRNNDIYLRAFPGGESRAVLRGHEHVVTRVEFHPSGRLLASSSHDETTRLWCFSPGGELVLRGERLLGFSSDGRRLFTKSFQEITEWELASPGDSLHYLPHGQGPSRGPWGIAFAPDGRLLASASQDGVHLWDAAAARQVGRVPSGDGYALAFHPKGHSLFSTGSGGWMQWPIAPERDGQLLRVGPGTVVRPTTAESRSLRIDVAGTGESLLLGAGDGGLDLVPLVEPGKGGRLGSHDDIFGVALSPDGRWAASTSGGGDTVCVWDVARSAFERRLPHGGARGYGMATFSPDGRWLVSGFRNDYCFWEVGSWELKTRQPGDPRSLYSSVAFARDSRLLALIDGRNRIHLYDTATLPLRRLATLETPDGPANLVGLSLSPDGTRLAATTDYNVIALWDLRRLRQELAALGLDWEMPPYPAAGEVTDPVRALTVEIHDAAKPK